MNRAIGFLLVLVPGMLVAQSSTRTSPQTSPDVHASLIAPPPLPSPSEPDSNTRVPARISTGLVLPKLLHTAPIVEPGRHQRLTAKKLVVIVEYTVDEEGNPQNAHVVESGNWELDGEVLAAVARFQYQPGTLNGQAIAFPMRLQYILDKGAEY